MTTTMRRLAGSLGEIPRRVLLALAAAALVLSGAAVALVAPTDDAIDGATTARATASQPERFAGEAGEKGADKDGSGAGMVNASGARTSDAVTGRDESSAQSTSPLPPGPLPVGSVVPGQPRIVKNAQVRVKVAEGSYRRAFDRASAIATAAGGFVISSNTATEGERASGELVLRVPSDHFDTARRQLAALGEVEDEQLSGEDVSGQLVDLAARIRSLQVQEEALRSLLARAKTVGEVLEVQSQLGQVRTQIEQLQAQQAALDESARLSTIRLSLFEPGATALRPEEPKGALAGSVERAIDASAAVLGGMVVVTGYALPFVVLAVLVWGGSRLRRRPATA